MRRVQPRVGVRAAVARTARVASLAAALLALVARNETAWTHERRWCWRCTGSAGAAAGLIEDIEQRAPERVTQAMAEAEDLE